MTLNNNNIIDISNSNSNLIEINEKYKDLDEIPKQAYNEIFNYLENERLNYILILDLTAGLGKTYISSMITSDMDSSILPYVYFTLNHDIAKQFNDFKINFFQDNSCTHMKGKGFVDKSVKSKCEFIGNLCYNCNNMDICEEFRECKDELGFKLILNYGRNDLYCKKLCPIKKSCEHKQEIMKLLRNFTPPSWCGHFLHYNTLYKIYEERWLDDFDILKIFDEDMSKSFIVRERFSFNILSEYLNNILNPNIKAFFELVKESLEQYNLIPYKISTQTLRDQCEETYRIKITDLVLKLDILELKRQKTKYEDLLYSNFNTPSQLKYKNPIDFLIEFKFFLENYDRNLEGYITITKYFVFFDYFRLINEKNNTIILNATYESELFKRLIPKQTKIKIIKISKEFSKSQKIYALKGKKGNDEKSKRYATYPLTSLYDSITKTYTDKYYELIEKARIFSKRHSKSVIFVVKKLLKETTNQFKKEIVAGSISVESYSRAVGENKYKEYDCAILLHTPYHNVTHLKKMTKLFDIDEELAFKNYNINLMVQAIFRIRPLSYDITIDKKCEILIFSSLDFPDFKFEKDHDITRFRLHEFDKLFNPDYKDIVMNNILTFIEKNPNCTITDIKRNVKNSDILIIKKTKLLLDKGYISYKVQDKKGKGRKSKLFFKNSDQERQKYLEFKRINEIIGD